MPARSSLQKALRCVFESWSTKYGCRVSLETTFRSSESADCHNRIAVQPLARNARSIRLSRRLLESIFSLQYLMFDRGRRNCLGLFMPKVPVCENDYLSVREDKVGPAWQSGVSPPSRNSMLAHYSDKLQFRCQVSRTSDSGHDMGPLQTAEHIRHINAPLFCSPRLPPAVSSKTLCPGNP